jgi:DNA repair protein RadA/Sms
MLVWKQLLQPQSNSANVNFHFSKFIQQQLQLVAKAPAKDPFRCAECGWTSTKWVGRCGECQAWGSVEEIVAPKKLSLVPGSVSQNATPIGEVSLESAKARSSGVSELDRVLGGGLVPGAAILLAGEPGVGKSTLLLSVAAQSAKEKMTALYISGEESASQVRLRAERLNAIDPNLWLAAENELGAVIAHIDAVKPELLIIDSIQTISSSAVDGAPGGVTQVREIAAALIRIAKDRNITLVLVGHVTKDGSIAGPRLLEHLVDVVLNFEGERHSRLRLIRAMKNRFGASDEVGCFDMSESGITSLTDPTGLFTTRHSEPVPGTCVTVALEGRRPLLAEIQALVGTPVAEGRDFGNSRRVTSGLDTPRTSMTLAVLELRANIRLSGRDVYVATVGGMKMNEPSADLAVALAVASAAKGLALPADLVAIGEVGLAGEIRKVTGAQQRIAEAARLGFKRAMVPTGSDLKIAGIEIMEVARLEQAIAKVKIS